VVPNALQDLESRIVACRRCPRLTEWRERVAREKKRAFSQCEYWGRPVPGWGDPAARVLVAGLAPAAHGANRTGRMFTGDRSGEWLYRALFKAGFADRPASESRGDGLRLADCWITAPVRCAPPANKPLPSEFRNCHAWLVDEMQLLMNLKIVIGLGKAGFEQAFISWNEVHGVAKRPRPKFGHGEIVRLEHGGWLIGSYHPSQQNTFTGRLTEAMFDEVFSAAKGLLGAAASRGTARPR
jgi:uracil-DNA glycosylase family 4